MAETKNKKKSSTSTASKKVADVKSTNTQVAEQVVKKKQTRRPRPEQQPQLEPGDNTKYINHSLRLADFERVNLKSPEAVNERIRTYFQICAEDDMKPSVVGLALCLGIERGYLWELRTGAKGNVPEVADLLKKAVTILNNQMEDYMQNGKINPVSGIFLMKNHYGYTDKQEVVVKPQTEQKDAETLLGEAEALPLIEE